MDYLERVGNVHVHTTLSDGHADHERVARAASRAGLDYVIITDHNVYAPEHEGWYEETLLLVGEEVHDPQQSPANHLLVLGVNESLAWAAHSPERLIAAVHERGGLGFIAHPFEHSSPYAGEPEINWLDWKVRGYAGMEIWNYMSEFKSHLSSLGQALLYAFAPKLAIRGPYAEALARWDDLLAEGHVTAIGGSDAHASRYQAGPLRREVFGYEHLFGAVNTHLFVTEPWARDVRRDSRLIYDALAAGRCFVAYDGLASTKGFSFTADHTRQTYVMGEEVSATGVVRFRVHAPSPARLRLILNGFCVAQGQGTDLEYESRTPGVYRVEAYRPYALRERGWIYSNPIYVRSAPHTSA